MSPMLEMVGSFWKVDKTIEGACKVGLQADDRMFAGVGKKKREGASLGFIYTTFGPRMTNIV